MASHRGDTIGKALNKCLKDWGITKLYTITVDNVSSNNVTLSYLTRYMSLQNENIFLKEEYMHLRVVPKNENPNLEIETLKVWSISFWLIKRYFFFL